MASQLDHMDEATCKAAQQMDADGLDEYIKIVEHSYHPASISKLRGWAFMKRTAERKQQSQGSGGSGSVPSSPAVPSGAAIDVTVAKAGHGSVKTKVEQSVTLAAKAVSNGSTTHSSAKSVAKAGHSSAKSKADQSTTSAASASSVAKAGHGSSASTTKAISSDKPAPKAISTAAPKTGSAARPSAAGTSSKASDAAHKTTSVSGQPAGEEQDEGEQSDDSERKRQAQALADEECERRRKAAGPQKATAGEWRRPRVPPEVDWTQYVSHPLAKCIAPNVTGVFLVCWAKSCNHERNFYTFECMLCEKSHANDYESHRTLLYHLRSVHANSIDVIDALRDANARRPLPKGLFLPRLKRKYCRGLEHISEAKQKKLIVRRDKTLSWTHPMQTYGCTAQSCEQELDYIKKGIAMHCHDFHSPQRLAAFKRQEPLVKRIKNIYKRKLAEELEKKRGKQAPTPQPKMRRRRARLTMAPARSKTPKRQVGDPERFGCYIGNCLNENDNNNYYQCELHLVEHYVKMHRCRAWAIIDEVKPPASDDPHPYSSASESEPERSDSEDECAGSEVEAEDLEPGSEEEGAEEPGSSSKGKMDKRKKKIKRENIKREKGTDGNAAERRGSVSVASTASSGSPRKGGRKGLPESLCRKVVTDVLDETGKKLGSKEEYEAQCRCRTAYATAFSVIRHMAICYPGGGLELMRKHGYAVPKSLLHRSIEGEKEWKRRHRSAGKVEEKDRAASSVSSEADHKDRKKHRRSHSRSGSREASERSVASGGRKERRSRSPAASADKKERCSRSRSGSGSREPSKPSASSAGRSGEHQRKRPHGAGQHGGTAAKQQKLQEGTLPEKNDIGSSDDERDSPCSIRSESAKQPKAMSTISPNTADNNIKNKLSLPTNGAPSTTSGRGKMGKQKGPAMPIDSAPATPNDPEPTATPTGGASRTSSAAETVEINEAAGGITTALTVAATLLGRKTSSQVSPTESVLSENYADDMRAEREAQCRKFDEVERIKEEQRKAASLAIDHGDGGSGDLAVSKPVEVAAAKGTMGLGGGQEYAGKKMLKARELRDSQKDKPVHSKGEVLNGDGIGMQGSTTKSHAELSKDGAQAGDDDKVSVEQDEEAGFKDREAANGTQEAGAKGESGLRLVVVDFRLSRTEKQKLNLQVERLLDCHYGLRDAFVDEDKEGMGDALMGASEAAFAIAAALNCLKK